MSPTPSKPGAAQRQCSLPLSSSTPKMPKTMKDRAQRMATLSSCPNDAMIDSISRGMPGTRFRARSGRIARAARMIEKLPSQGTKKETMPSITTTKSSQLHGSRRYAPRPSTKPNDSTLTTISAVKIASATCSHVPIKAAFCVPGGSKGEFHAIKAQLPRITSRMNGSKSGDSTMLIACLRGVLRAPKRKSDFPA